MEIFVNDDSGYLDWIDRHPDGFVVNTYRTPNPQYLLIHRASCHSISKKTSPDYTWTEGGYLKACASAYDELDRWARREVGGELKACTLCKPL